MKKNLSKREKIDFNKIENITLEIDNLLVQSIDGVIIGGDAEQVNLLFYYIKPDSYNNSNYVVDGIGVAEFRISISKFINMSQDLNFKIKELNNNNEQNMMFI